VRVGGWLRVEQAERLKPLLRTVGTVPARVGAWHLVRLLDEPKDAPETGAGSIEGGDR
jgi:hypothetical protein